MEHSHDPHHIYQIRIVLRGISPLIWRRVLVRHEATLAQLHDIIQILFAWHHEHLYDFHVYGKDHGTGGADTKGVQLSQFQFRKGERFRYVYDYTAYWVCDIRLEATLPVDSKNVYPVCTGGKNASPSENFLDVEDYMEQIDQHRYNLPVDAMLVIADALKVIDETDPAVFLRETMLDMAAIRGAAVNGRWTDIRTMARSGVVWAINGIAASGRILEPLLTLQRGREAISLPCATIRFFHTQFICTGITIE